MDPMQPRTLLRLLAVLVVIVTLTGAAIGWVVVSGLGRLLDDVGSDTETTVLASIDATDAAITGVLEAVRGLDQLGIGLATATAEAATVVEEVAELTAVEIPQSLSAVDRSMPALIDAATLIDTSMRALTILGVEYDPPVPFPDALREVDASLEGLPESIRQQGEALGSLAPRVVDLGERSSAVLGRLAALESDLTSAQVLLDQYRGVIDRTSSSVAGGRLFGFGLPLIRGALATFAVAGAVLGLALWMLAGRDARLEIQVDDETGVEASHPG